MQEDSCVHQLNTCLHQMYVCYVSIGNALMRNDFLRATY